jgi:carbamoyl-phosphate synthase large subunit
MRLLVLSAGTQVGQNVLATLAGRRDDIQVIAASSVDNEPALFDFDAVFSVPQTLAASDAFERRVLDILEAERIDLVIPCRDDDVLFLGALRDRRPDLAARLLSGGGAAARVINDKWLSHEFSMAHGLPFAASMVGGEAAARAAFVRRHGFPLVAKPRGGWASMDVYLVNTQRQLATMLARDDFVVQQFLGDPQSMADYLARLDTHGVPLYHDFQGLKHSMQALIAPDGSIADVFSMHLVRQMRRSKWVQPDRDPASHDIAHRCAQAFSAAGWRGPLNIQCRKTVDGKLLIHEFSGRFTGATVDRWLLGFDEVGLAIERFTGIRLRSERGAAPAALEAFESRVGRAADPRHVEVLARDGVWRRQG